MLDQVQQCVFQRVLGRAGKILVLLLVSRPAIRMLESGRYLVRKNEASILYAKEVFHRISWPAIRCQSHDLARFEVAPEDLNGRGRKNTSEAAKPRHRALSEHPPRNAASTVLFERLDLSP